MPRRTIGAARLLRLVAAVVLATPLFGGSIAAVSFGQDIGTPPIATPQGRSGDTDPVLYDAIRSELRNEIYASTAGYLSRYRINAELIPNPDGTGSIVGTLALRFVNLTPVELTEVYIRLYANDAIYAEGGMRLRNVTTDGVKLAPELTVDNTVARLGLPSPLGAGAASDIVMEFQTVVPVSPEFGYGIYSVDGERNTWALAHWYPLLAGYDSHGWSTDPLSRNGDPIFSNTALYDVSLSAPDGWVVATTGIELPSADSGTTRRRYVSGPVRDFTIVADDDFAAVRHDIAGTTVTSYFDPANAAAGQTVLDSAVAALDIYSKRFGPYPFREMDITQVTLKGAGGVEFPQLMYMGTSLYGDPGRFRNPDYLEFVTAHEVGHQWWYGVVGNNQHLDAFIDEGLTEYVGADVYFGDRYGEAVGTFQLKLECQLWYLNELFINGDDIVDQPTDDFPTEAAYGAMVYGKGALAFDALRSDIGDDAFFAGLQDYYTEFRFGIATPADLRAAFERAAGRDLGAFWTSWFEREDGMTIYADADYNALLVELGLR